MFPIQEIYKLGYNYNIEMVDANRIQQRQYRSIYISIGSKLTKNENKTNDISQIIPHIERSEESLIIAIDRFGNEEDKEYNFKKIVSKIPENTKVSVFFINSFLTDRIIQFLLDIIKNNHYKDKIMVCNFVKFMSPEPSYMETKSANVVDKQLYSHFKNYYYNWSGNIGSIFRYILWKGIANKEVQPKISMVLFNPIIKTLKAKGTQITIDSIKEEYETGSYKNPKIISGLYLLMNASYDIKSNNIFESIGEQLKIH